MNSIEDLIFTLHICRKSLPGNADPVHFERLNEIERRLRELQTRQELEARRKDQPQTGQVR